MLTKYLIQFKGESHEFTSEHLRNWADIQCAYSRKDFGGIIRSFSSKFEFVRDAYDLMMGLYLSDGVCAKATITILTKTEYWTWEPQFSSALDFSTISWDKCVLTISAVDDTLGALLNARKNSKYEFEVGADIMPDNALAYDRLIMANSVTHEVTGNAEADGRGSVVSSEAVALTSTSSFKRVPTYVVGNPETYENSPISVEDESEADGAYMMRVERSGADFTIEIDMTFSPEARPDNGTNSILHSAEIHLMSFTSANPNYNSSYEDLGTVLSYNETDTMEYLGCYQSLDALKAAHPNPAQGVYAVIGASNSKEDAEAVYITPFTNKENVEWMEGVPYKYSNRGTTVVSCRTRRFIYSFHISDKPVGTLFGLFYKANIEWTQFFPAGEPVRFLIQKTSIKTKWTSRAKAISIDALKLETVARTLVDRITESAGSVGVQISTYDPRVAKTAIFAAESIRGIPGAKLYTSFKDFCDFMLTVFGYVHCIRDDSNGNQIVAFVHRKELFNDTSVKKIHEVTDLNYTIDQSLIYGNVEIGYEKHDYEAECGRDEWNFTNYYTTGIEVVDKTLSLKSKYRADCYGFEFTAQKRAQDSTDNKSDATVFIAYCKDDENDGENNDDELPRLVIDRSVTIEGALSDSVFNGEYNPGKCLEANAEYIAAYGIPTTLKFTSGDGNTDITIDGVERRADRTISSHLFSCAELTFYTCDIQLPENVNSLVTLTRGGITYRGYITQVNLHYAKTQSAKYKLIVKDLQYDI